MPIQTLEDVLHGADPLRRVIDHVVALFQRDRGVDLTGEALAMSRLQEAATAAVATLQREGTATIFVPFITATADGPLHLEATIQRHDVGL